jgi:hypothetical protein
MYHSSYSGKNHILAWVVPLSGHSGFFFRIAGLVGKVDSAKLAFVDCDVDDSFGG